MLTYDLIVIGFGKAGKTLAAKMAAQGKKVALIERSKAMYGGTCINIACMSQLKKAWLSTKSWLKRMLLPAVSTGRTTQQSVVLVLTSSMRKLISFPITSSKAQLAMRKRN